MRVGYGKPDLATNVSFGPSATKKYTTTYFRRALQFRQADCMVGSVYRCVGVGWGWGICVRLQFHCHPRGMLDGAANVPKHCPDQAAMSG